MIRKARLWVAIQRLRRQADKAERLLQREVQLFWQEWDAVDKVREGRL